MDSQFCFSYNWHSTKDTDNVPDKQSENDLVQQSITCHKVKVMTIHMPLMLQIPFAHLGLPPNLQSSTNFYLPTLVAETDQANIVTPLKKHGNKPQSRCPGEELLRKSAPISSSTKASAQLHHR